MVAILSGELRRSSETSNLPQRSHYHKAYEEHAYVLDYLPYGRGRNDRHTSFISPIVQLIGERHFTLLEASLKPGVSASPHEKLYIGRETRDKVLRVVGRISFNGYFIIYGGKLDNSKPSISTIWSVLIIRK